MSRRVLIGFVVVNVMVSLAVAFLVIAIDRSRRPKVEPIPGPTQIVYYTQAPAAEGDGIKPGQYQATVDSLQGTLNALSRVTPQAILPTAAENLGEVGSAAIPGAATIATLNPALLPPVPSELPPGQPSPTPQDDGCIQHVIESGDLISTIAQEYGVLPGDILLANDMTEDDAFNLQIGDILIIPVAGCDALNTPTAAPLPTNTPFSLTRVAATVTLPATAVDAQVEITNVLNWGDVNNEAVELRNMGPAVNLQGWQLADETGEIFLFPEARMQQGSRVLIFTRQGANTPAALFWGQDTAVWEEGETITLTDSSGQIQATFRVGSAGAVPTTPTPEGLSEG